MLSMSTITSIDTHQNNFFITPRQYLITHINECHNIYVTSEQLLPVFYCGCSLKYANYYVINFVIIKQVYAELDGITLQMDTSIAIINSERSMQ